MPDPITQSMIQGAAGAAGETKYIDDVFSNYLYKGLGTTANTIGLYNRRKGTGNVVDNLRSLLTLSNNVLQGDFDRAGNTAARFGINTCLLYTSPSPRDRQKSRMPSSA